MKQETNNKGISEKEVTCTEVLLDHENNICYQRNLTKKSNLVMLVQYFVFQGTTMISIYTLIGPLWNLFPLFMSLPSSVSPFVVGKNSRLLINVEENISKTGANRFRYHSMKTS